MPIRLPKYGFTYFPIPKVACTSLKHVFHELKRGAAFEPRVKPNGMKQHIHDVHPSLPFARVDHQRYANDTKLVVIREPTLRLISAYRNRVLHHWELSAKGPAWPELERRRLPDDPDLQTFVERLAEYREAVRPIQHHTEPQRTFIGPDLSYFDRVFHMEQLDELQRFIEERTGSPINFPRLQTGGPRITLADLSREALERIIDFYAADYELLRDHYDPQDIIAEHARAHQAAGEASANEPSAKSP